MKNDKSGAQYTKSFMNKKIYGNARGIYIYIYIYIYI